jgi:hypothetical protein
MDPTGATDSSGGLALACASSRRVQFPAGTYTIHLKAGVSSPCVFPSGGGAIIQGEGAKTIFNVINDDGAFHTIFSASGPTTALKDFTLNYTGVVGSSDTTIMVATASTTVMLDNLTVNGGIATTSSSTLNWKFNPLQYAGNTADVTVQNSRFTATGYIAQKSNAQTTGSIKLHYYNNTFNQMWGDLLNNSPLGACTDIDIEHNTFYDNLWTTAYGGGGNGQFWISVAGCQSARIISNTGTGLVEAGVHFEDSTAHLIIADNNFNPNGGKCIEAVPNNVSTSGGAYVSPSYVNISNNDCLNTGSLTGITGIDAGINSNGPGIVNGIISGNTLTNFATGIKDGARPQDDLEVVGNHILSGTPGTQGTGTIGIQAQQASQSIRENTIVDQITGVQVSGGGTLGTNTFQDVTTPWASSGSSFAITGSKFIIPSYTHACGSTYVDVPLFSKSKVTYFGTLTGYDTGSGATNNVAYSANQIVTSGTSNATFVAPTSLTNPAQGAAFVAGISGFNLTVSTVTSGTIAVGQQITTGALAGTVITGGSGTAWTVNLSQSVTTGTSMVASGVTTPSSYSPGNLAAGSKYNTGTGTIDAYMFCNATAGANITVYAEYQLTGAGAVAP